MKGYEYQLLRYTHDIFTGEFVNVGIIFYVPEEKYINFHGLTRFRRVSDFFHGINGHFLLSSIKHVESQVNIFKEELSGLPFHQPIGVKSITDKISPPNEGALQFSEVYTGITLSPETTFKSMLKMFITDYDNENKKKSRTDDEAWRNVYRNYFEINGILPKLQEHTIESSLDKFSFEHCFKNEIWHCFEPVSFDLADTEGVKDKVYKWAGKIRNLFDTTEEFKLYLLTLSPSVDILKDTKNFIEKTLKLSALNPDQFEIVKEEEVETFSKKMADFIQAHN